MPNSMRMGVLWVIYILVLNKIKKTSCIFYLSLYLQQTKSVSLVETLYVRPSVLINTCWWSFFNISLEIKASEMNVALWTFVLVLVLNIVFLSRRRLLSSQQYVITSPQNCSGQVSLNLLRQDFNVDQTNVLQDPLLNCFQTILFRACKVVKSRYQEGAFPDV